MREIKAWDKRNKQMKKVWAIDYQINEVELSDKFDGYWTKFEDVILLQYTGLKDKYGVKICEGDIVENGNGKVGYIVFLIQEAGFVVVLKDRDYRLGHRNTGEGYIMADNHKVIGSIYENPGLLEEMER